MNESEAEFTSTLLRKQPVSLQEPNRNEEKQPTGEATENKQERESTVKSSLKWLLWET